MPELPEVERGRRIAESVAAGRVITDVRCARDPIVFEGVGAARIRNVLKGRTVHAVRRRGKHIWFELDARPWPLFHFGMSGQFHVPAEDPVELMAGPKTARDGWPPRYTKIRLRFDNGGALAMTNARRLGRIRLREDPGSEPPISLLGFDPLLDLPDSRTLARLIGGRRISLKGLLLDQGFAAGVGNWIADEVLYQAKLDPRRPASSLGRDEVRRMRAKLRSVIHHAVAVDSNKRRFPRTWLFHCRWGREEGARTRRGEPIEHITLAGRTTAWVPSVQK